MTRKITFSQAIREAMTEETERDPAIFLMGEDVGVFGGVFGVSAGMIERFGETRVRDTPISEQAIVGAGLGAALVGMRPIVEIMFADFVAVAMDQIVNQAAKARYMSGGKANVPLIMRVVNGAPGSAAAQHSQSPESWFMNVPGLKIAIPATPYDAKGLLKTAIREADPRTTQIPRNLFLLFPRFFKIILPALFFFQINLCNFWSSLVCFWLVGV